ncbi:MAG: hypothetical protein E6L08_10530 [Verrucomicrobia bacterium]|nr:MAG: hypothetical protein E6L08_10530 [Verrucomicrobiota bacterium]
MKTYARNKAELAKLLGISRSGLQRFYELPNHPEPKADGRLEVKGWGRFISSNATRVTTGTSVIPLGLKDKTRVSLMELQIQREAVRLDKERGDSLNEMHTILKSRIETFRNRLEKLLRYELPPVLEQRGAREIEKICVDRLRKIWDEWCREAGDRVRDRVRDRRSATA